MKTLRKILASVLAVLMLAGIVPIASINSFAADDILQYLTYKIEDGVAKITRCDKEISGDITLPSTIEGCPVVEISDDAFWSCENITSITIGNSVNDIGDSAFLNCKSLVNIALPDSVKYIGPHAFYDCKNLKSINIPEGIEGIYNETFYNCENLQSIDIPNSLKYLGLLVFENCHSLKEINLPDGVECISDGVLCCFASCSSLRTIKIPSGVKTIAGECFSNCTGLSSVTINNTLEKIEFGAFYNCPELKDIYYSGTIEEWKNIEIEERGNEDLCRATIHCLDGDIAPTYVDPDPDTEIIIYDPENNVVAEFNAGAFGGENVSLNVTPYDYNDGDAGRLVHDFSLTRYRDIPVYNIYFTDVNGNTVQPVDGETVTVKIYYDDVDENVSNVKIFHYWYGEDGTLVSEVIRDVTYDYDEQCFVFEVSHFSSFIICTDAPVAPAPYINIISGDLTLNKKQSEKLDAEASGNIIWTSSNEKVATVDRDGNVTAHKKGTATITATVEGTNVSESRNVTVKYTILQWLIIIVLFGWIWY